MFTLEWMYAPSDFDVKNLFCGNRPEALQHILLCTEYLKFQFTNLPVVIRVNPQISQKGPQCQSNKKYPKSC